MAAEPQQLRAALSEAAKVPADSVGVMVAEMLRVLLFRTFLLS